MKNRLNIRTLAQALLFLATFVQVEFICGTSDQLHQTRMFEVMYKGPGGIEQLNRKIKSVFTIFLTCCKISACSLHSRSLR